AGTNFYVRAKIELFNYSDEHQPTIENEERGKSFQTGNVELWTEKTDNTEAHGTDIILHNIKKSAKDQLKSLDRWNQIENETDEDELDEAQDSTKAQLPDFHVGYISKSNGTDIYVGEEDEMPSLPWDESTTPEDKFLKLYQAILDKTKNAVSPKLHQILDNYLNMIWNLGLSIPLDYIESHPFELTRTEIPELYTISNSKKGQAENLYDKMDDNVCIGDHLGFKSHKIKHNFNVIVDGIKLFRPLKYTDLPESKAIVKKPILFVGGYRSNFKNIDTTLSGGNLEFEAYLLWAPKISPKDHNGALIRIYDAAGVMFDETFMKYQVAEHTIKSQLVVEIFVNKGLDSALNIDRESFNISHPHYQIVQTWLHSALRQVINRYKKIRSEKRTTQSNSNQDAFSRSLNNIVNDAYIANDKLPEERSSLIITKEESATSTTTHNTKVVQIFDNQSDNFIISENKITKTLIPITQSKTKQSRILSKSEAILQVLDSYGLLENLTVENQEKLVLDIVKILGLEG
ncbi:ATP-binding protein, partial [Vibrio fluvialis]|nr:ATP-binding protein [Vibrio fluvialis]